MKPFNKHKPLLQRLKRNPRINPQLGKYALKQLADETPVQVHHSKDQEDEQQIQLISTNTKERAINLSDLILLL